MKITRFLTVPVAVVVVALAASAVVAKPATLGPGELQARLQAAIDFAPPSDALLLVRQPDGTRFGARLTPAALGGLLEVRGYTILKGADGWWRYAKAPGVASTRLVGKDSPAGIAKGVGRVRASSVTPSAAFAAQLQEAAGRAAAAMRTRRSAAGPTVFKFPVLLLATWWDTSKGQTEPQFQAGNDDEHFHQILNGFGGNPKGSLTEFYFENSYGQFLVQVDVFGPYTSNRSRADRCYYGGIDVPPDFTDDLDPIDNVFGVGGLGAVGMAVEAVPQADPAVDFTQYDNDGDGYIDFMGIVHSGADMAVTGDPCNTWSHALPVSALTGIGESILGLPPDTLRGGFPTTDGVLVDRVFTMPEFPEAGEELAIGVAAHEMAHALGEPDHYAVNGSSSGDGDWDIMSGGSYLGSPSGSNPSWFNPVTRVWQGWTTPTIVHGDLNDYKLAPREKPMPGYASTQANPNLLLVPTRWIQVGETDSEGHEWTDRDVIGLVQDGAHGYVIEGWYLEYASRTAGPYPPLGQMGRSPSFDRGLHGGGLLSWHFDYWRRSNVLYGANNAQDDPNRMQVDVEEFDYYDNTQDIALNLHRGEGSDPFLTTATGMTSGTHQLSPDGTASGGSPQSDIPLSGTTAPATPANAPFTVDPNPANHTMTVTIAADGAPPGDCKLQLFRDGQPESDEVDSGSVGDPETVIITDPEPGSWVARVSDYALCTSWTGNVHFEAPGGFDTRGSADTWSDETQEPTGWAFTNIRAGATDGLDFAAESRGTNELVLDVLNLSGKTDVSPGYAQPALNGLGGRGVVTAGHANAFSVPIFSNGSGAPGQVAVEVHRDKAKGKIVAQGTVTLAAYERKQFAFTFDPGTEGPYSLYVTVDPKKKVAEGSEDNNTQGGDGWAGPASPKVLVVDDEGYTDGESAYAGALAALGVPYAIASTHVPAATMAQYPAVIWAGSIDRGPGQLDAADRSAIGTYLDGGGKLWLASNRAAGALEAEGADAFLHGYFGADAIETTTFENPHTVEGTGGVLGSDTFGLQPYPIRPFSDVVDVAGSGVNGSSAQVLELANANKVGRDGAAFGTRVIGSGGFKTVLTPFSLSQVASADTAVKLTRSVLQFFGVGLDQYTPKTKEPLLFHSAVRFQVSGRPTPIVAIVVGGKASKKATPVDLYYRVHGNRSFERASMTRGSEPGTYNATLPSGVITPAGVDYYLVADKKTYDPPQAKKDTAHAIAVGRPG